MIGILMRTLDMYPGRMPYENWSYVATSHKLPKSRRGTWNRFFPSVEREHNSVDLDFDSNLLNSVKNFTTLCKKVPYAVLNYGSPGKLIHVTKKSNYIF